MERQQDHFKYSGHCLLLWAMAAWKDQEGRAGRGGESPTAVQASVSIICSMSSILTKPRSPSFVRLDPCGGESHRFGGAPALPGRVREG